MRLYDPLEMNLPDLGLVTMRDAETGEQIVVDTQDSGFRKRFAAIAQKREDALREGLAHAGVDTLERMDIIRDLRMGKFDVLIGINLLREGLDIPEVSLVAILDADKEGFLRSERSLIQTIGRAARNARGEVWLYADRVSEAMQRAIEETNRRRALQEAYNLEHGITPETVRKEVRAVIRPEGYEEAPLEADLSGEDLRERIAELELAMWQAAEALDFERAARLRDEIRALEARLQGVKTPEPVPGGRRRRKRR